MDKQRSGRRLVLKVIRKMQNLCLDSLRFIANRASLFFNDVRVGKALSLRGRIFVRNDGSIRLGDFVTINSGQNINPIGGDTRFQMHVFRGGEIAVGNYVGMSNCTIVSASQVIIEDYVKIGGGVRIYDLDFHALDSESRRDPKTDISHSEPVHIGQDAFIGAGSIILKGVHIGERSIVGAGSVVAKSIPAGEIWAGNPARFIKKV